MSIEFAMGLDHIANFNSAEANWSKIAGRLPFFGQGAAGNAKRMVFSAGWLTSQITSGTTWLAAVFDTAVHATPETTQSWFGFRWKIVSGGSIASPTSLLWVALSNYPTSTTFINFLTWGEILALYPNVTSREFYFEACIDWENGVLKRRVNGIDLSDIALTALSSGVTARNLRFFLPLSSAANHSNAVRDFIWVNNDGEGVQGPIGPHRLTPLEETVEAETTWTSTSGTINTPQATLVGAASNTDTPAWVSPNPKTPLKIGLKLPTGLMHKGITAIVAGVSAGLSAGSVGDVKLKFTDGVNSTPIKTVNLDVGMTHNYKLSVDEKAPDGADWNTAKVNASSLVIDAT